MKSLIDDDHVQKVITMSSDDLLKETIHEFNNSLTTILGFAKVVMYSEKLDDSLKEHIDTIYEAALHSKNIIDDLNSSDGFENKKLNCSISINKLVESAIRMASIRWKENSKLKRIGIQFVRSLESKSDIYVNPSEITQVILNILLNAIDSFDQDGEIYIETRDSRGELMLKISDNGEGMDKGIIENLFDPYFTTKGDKGKGLGLHISKCIIEKYDARIEVESEKDIGTTFKIYFKIHN